MMEVAYQVNRRKACDLCFFKKIKCDMLEPTCSNCRLYKAECCTTRARKRFKSARPQPVELPGSPIAPDHTAMASQDDETRRIEGIESRLARMEERIEQIFSAVTAATTQSQETPSLVTTARSPFPVPNQPPDQPLTHFDIEFNGVLSQPSSETHPIDLAASEAPISGMKWTNSYPHLPPFEEIQPIIEHYFTHINSLMPLFSQTTFLRKLHDYYASECQNPRKTWAAINIVLALGTRLPTSPSDDLDLQNEDGQVAKYVSNVQSVLSELVTRDVDLLSLQVLLGLVIIFNSLKDSSPAVVLIGTAIRLAHRLRLHNRDHQHNNPDEALQRSRVFWIAYLFDKDICIRHHTPSVQADDDIDLDLPIDMPPDGAGNVYAKDGRFLVNFFRLRLRLAHVQGQVYDQLFSTRASKITPQERQRRVALLHNQLERWRLTVPPELQADVVTEHANRTTVFWLCMTHFSYLGCLVMIHGMWSHDAEWRKRLKPSTFGSDDIDRPRSLPPLPGGWKYCVHMSRHCMMLMCRAPLSDCSIWTNGCAYFSALIIILANLLENPMYKAVDDDLQLTHYAVGIFDRMSDASSIVQMKRLNVVAAELDRRARLVVKHVRQFIAVNGSPPLERHYHRDIDQDSLTGLQWDWGDDGVEAWPNMDVSLNDAYSSIIFGSELPGVEFGPFDNWMESQMGKLFSPPQFSTFTGFSG